MRYIPHTEDDIQAMLKALDLNTVDALFSDIPAHARMTRPLDVPGPLAEMELQQFMADRANDNRNANQGPCFLGAQFYDRFIPAAVGALAFRGEFATAYTPYQPELSQGTLASIYEFQTMMASLTGLYAAQASMYDGSSAVGEAALLAMAATGRSTVVAADGLFPDSRRVVDTYLKARGGKIVVVNGEDLANGTLEGFTDTIAAVIVQQPDVFGSICDYRRLVEKAHALGALAIAAVDPVAMALVEPPGAMGFDVAVGEGQPLGNRMQYGGPTFGFFAVTEPLVRRLPGRLVGMTHDAQGRRGFVLTLQAREQHIRREKATSNICSNHSLNALQATIYMSLLGPEGLRDVARLSAAKAHYLVERLLTIPGVERFRRGPYLYEVALKMPGDVSDLNRHLLAAGIIGGFDMGTWDARWASGWQIAVTEKRSRAELDKLIEEVTRWTSR